MSARIKWMRYYKIKNTDFVFFLLTLFLIGFIFGINYSPIKVVKEEVLRYKMPNLTTITEERMVEMLVPAADDQGNGAVAKLVTRVRPAVSPGYGMMMVGINDVLAQYDTQLSARIAAKAAEEYTGMDLADFDIIYTIEVNATVIEGPSAGAAMAISVVAALQDSEINKSVMITGTIDDEGKIGVAGAIPEKISAAKENDITLFLVSSDLPPQSTVKSEKSCNKINKIEYCEINYVPKETDLSEEFGIELKMITELEDALDYFLI